MNTQLSPENKEDLDQQTLPENKEETDLQTASDVQTKEPVSIGKNRLRSILHYTALVLCGLAFLLTGGGIGFLIWYKKTFNISFAELLNTMAGGLNGTGHETTMEVVYACLPGILITLFVYITAYLLIRFKVPSRFKVLCLRIGAAICAASLLVTATTAVFILRIPEYLSAKMQSTDLYENYYIDPNDVVISATGKPKNLIYIYVESLETTYQNAQILPDAPFNNYIPKIEQLALDNISFTEKGEGQLGGFHSPIGTGWTIAALLSTSSGVPFAFPVGHNDMSKHDSFASGLTTLGDILAEKGYKNVFLCGSDAKFGGRELYYTQHGNYQIYDLYTAREEGYVSPTYHDGWWGYEDHYLFEIAKDKLTALAKGDQPFNFTMLTVDLHHNSGHRCKLCNYDYKYRLENVLSCTDKQLTEFVSWIQSQSFYQDCAIVITGDHRRMDNTLVKDVPEEQRTVYNCFINAVPTPSKTFNRTFTSFDIFPTTLAAMGFTIEGDRLGLGTNLFSEKETLAEQIGYDVLHAEVQKKSEYYDEHFCD